MRAHRWCSDIHIEYFFSKNCPTFEMFRFGFFMIEIVMSEINFEKRDFAGSDMRFNSSCESLGAATECQNYLIEKFEESIINFNLIIFLFEVYS